MSFKIVITETKDVRKTLPRQWAPVDKEEVERESRFVGDDGDRTFIRDVYGYTPEVETVSTETREILSQEVDELDLRSVMQAINDL